MNCTIDANCSSGFCRAGSCKYINIISYPDVAGLQGYGHANYEIIFTDQSQSKSQSSGGSKKATVLFSLLLFVNFFL